MTAARPFRSVVVGFVCLGVCATLPAQPAAPAKSLLKVEDLYRFDGPRDTALSPDGKTLAYARAWIDANQRADRSSLWVVDGDPAKARAAEPGEPDARVPVFAPDGKRIAFLSTRPRPTGWKQTPPVPPQSDPATDIWLITTAGGPAIPLAGSNKPYGRVFNDGFYGRVAFSPDGTKLAFVADDGTDPRTPAEKSNDVSIVREDQGEGYTGYGTAHVWVAHLDPKPGAFAASKVERLTPGDAWYGDPQWTPDGATLVVHANRTDDRESVRFSINKNYDLWAIDVATKRLRQLTTGPGPDVSPRVSPDGKRVAFLSVPRKGAHREVFNLAVVPLDGPEPKAKARVLFDNRTPMYMNTPLPYPAFPLPADCWDGGTHLIVNTEDGVRNRAVRVDVASGRAEPFEPTAAKDVGVPASVGERAARRTQLTPPANRFLKEYADGPQQVLRWKSADGLEIEGILTTPPAGVAKPPHKLVVYPHGGPHSRSTLGFDFTVQVFAAQGYAVFQPNFRGSSGYGQAFVDADRNDFGGGDMRDILSGVDKLVSDGVADKDRLCVYGTSYGGYMTTWLVGQTDRFRAAVAQNPVTDLNMMWCLSDIQSWTEWEFGGKPWEVPEKMRKHSPLTYADRVKTPTLLLHARDDRRCPLPMGRAYHQALRSRGVPTDLVIYPDEGHGIRQPQHREDVLRRVLEWFAQHDKK